MKESWAKALALGLLLAASSCSAQHGAEAEVENVPAAVKEMAGKSGATEVGQVLVRGSMINLVTRSGNAWQNGGGQAGDDYENFGTQETAPAYTPVSIDKMPLEQLADKMASLTCEGGARKMGQIDSAGTGAMVVSVGCAKPNEEKFSATFLDGANAPTIDSWANERSVTTVLGEAKLLVGGSLTQLEFKVADSTLPESRTRAIVVGAAAKQPDGRTCHPTIQRYGSPEQANGGKAPMVRLDDCGEKQNSGVFNVDQVKPAALVAAMGKAAKKLGVDVAAVQSFEVGLLDGVLELRAYHQSKQAGVPLG